MDINSDIKTGVLIVVVNRIQNIHPIENQSGKNDSVHLKYTKDSYWGKNVNGCYDAKKI